MIVILPIEEFGPASDRRENCHRNNLFKRMEESDSETTDIESDWKAGDYSSCESSEEEEQRKPSETKQSANHQYERQKKRKKKK